MPLKTVTTAGTQVQLSTTATRATRVTLQRISSNTGAIYVGLANVQGNTGADVSSSAYDCYLDASNPSVTFGLGDEGSGHMALTDIWIDSAVNGEGVAYFLEQD